jgi:CheY-like chemotaxis protein
MIKPPRQARLLKLLTEISPCITASPPAEVAPPRDGAELTTRTLYGNILVAEGSFGASHAVVANPFSDNAVAQALLIKQLERYQRSVTAANDGVEALRGLCTFTRLSSNWLTVYPAWETHEPGHFVLALFDHRKLLYPTVSAGAQYDVTDMPVCDGVEATKRLRKLENTRCATIRLPGSSIASMACCRISLSYAYFH